MTYKKLFPIDYNNKKFMIFLDENNRKTFLEIDAKGEYNYPFLEDYVNLYKIFNMKEPFICYSVPKFKFLEKVKLNKGVTTTVLALLTIINMIPSVYANDIKVNIEEGQVVIEEVIPKQTQEQKITDLNDLNKYLGEINVTKEIVQEAINNNPNLNEKYKRIATKLLNAIIAKNPNTNLRIFYENIKSMTIKEYTIEEFRKAFPEAPGGGAQYNCQTNTITTIDTIPIETLYHEMYHSFHNFYRELDGKIYYRVDDNTALNESMTDIGASLVTTIKNGYRFTRGVTEYLRTLVDFSLDDYNSKGTDDLIAKLQAKYPNLDINYIKETLNTYNYNLIYLGKETPIDLLEDFRNELFEMCLKEANINSGYEPFNQFAKIFSYATDPTLVLTYFDLYNNKLISLGYKDIISRSDIENKLDIFKKANGVGFENGTAFAIIQDIQKPNKNPQKLGLDRTVFTLEHAIPLATTFDFQSRLSASIFSNYNTFGTSKYWIQMSKDYGLFSPHLIEPIPIYQGSNLITNANTSTLRVQVGISKEGKVGFVITNKDGEFVYQTIEGLDYLTNKISLEYYINSFSYYIEKIDVDDVLNESYLKIFQSKNENYRFDIEIIEGNIVFIPKEKNAINQTENIVPIYKDNNLLTQDYLSNLYISVGETIDKQIGFIITNKMGEIIYQSSPQLFNCSSSISFTSYVGPTLSKLNLDDVLNEEFLKNYQKQTKAFNNIEIVEDKIIIDASPRVNITRYNGENKEDYLYKLSNCKISVNNGNIIIGNELMIPSTLNKNITITLEEVLKYAGVFIDGIPEYHFNIEDIESMINNYVNDLYKGVKR